MKNYYDSCKKIKRKKNTYEQRYINRKVNFSVEP